MFSFGSLPPPHHHQHQAAPPPSLPSPPLKCTPHMLQCVWCSGESGLRAGAVSSELLDSVCSEVMEGWGVAPDRLTDRQICRAWGHQATIIYQSRCSRKVFQLIIFASWYCTVYRNRSCLSNAQNAHQHGFYILSYLIVVNQLRSKNAAGAV